MQWLLFDYGVGNLHSLQKALDQVGAQTAVTTNPDDLEQADIVVLPGVGAFGHVMDQLEPARDALRRRHAEGRPILGVCIGMQVLFEGSDESPNHAGLGIIPGDAQKIPSSAGKVPHMGWNTLSCEDDVLSFANGRFVYYVHSFAAPADAPGTLATTEYGSPFCAVVRAKNTLGFQFHPEKSSTVGHDLLAWARKELEEVA